MKRQNNGEKTHTPKKNKKETKRSTEVNTVPEMAFSRLRAITDTNSLIKWLNKAQLSIHEGKESIILIKRTTKRQLSFKDGGISLPLQRSNQFGTAI